MECSTNQYNPEQRIHQTGSTLTRYFHVARRARLTYSLTADLFSIRGRVIFGNFHAARVLADGLNRKRNVAADPDKAIHASDVYAAGLLHEILHYIITLYVQQNPGILQEAYDTLRQTIGDDDFDGTLTAFVDSFPPRAVFQGQMTPRQYLAENRDAQANQLITLEEVLILRLSNENPALSFLEELVDDSELTSDTLYTRIIEALEQYFDTGPAFGPDNESLINMLRRPARQAPDSLRGQLQFVRERWGSLLSSSFFDRLLKSLDFIEEEEKARYLRFQGPGPGPPLLEPYDYTGLGEEAERFSQDLDWMPNVVMIAKSTLVWLDQLSRKYQRHIQRIDQIPDEELDRLSRWGFRGLWLIGIWKRSDASRRIKQMMGNPDASASAYSLFDYAISDDLGGYEAFQNLRDRCWQRGIRLASDMVPNHTGIDSRWVMQHPDWFVQLSYAPYPSYSFYGTNLSNDENVGLYLEDHYYDRSDAAVVFKRVHFNSGDTRYIYHGNDGTSMPWNDTAQLDFTKQEVREAVIQTILHVAKMFPIIRFDAAMTLTKKHFQRLWFPDPGSGGGIPSRAEHGLTRRQFDQVMPVEFWREVVERVQQEVPDTLLLAEAFWHMEGYFVRTLGMHRVYNSAFMNMLKMEENAKYRKVIKDTLEFDPEILKRYVNFMNNPDEETAIAQFGKDDKYFGVCLMMATMPGLPMFGHGQIEGFTEKYGMEYSRAHWDEHADEHLVRRHEREIFPLMRHRYLFAGVENFLLYDFFSPHGHVNENVFAYSNRVGDARALVVYNNRYEQASGWIKTSAAFLDKKTPERNLVQRTLGEGLGLRNRSRYYCIFRDHIQNLEFLRTSVSLCNDGMFVSLEAFNYHVFLNFREVHDVNGEYERLSRELNGRGVPDIELARKKMLLRPIHQEFTKVLEVLDRMVRTTDESLGPFEASAGPATGGPSTTKTSARESAENRTGDANIEELLESAMKDFAAAAARHFEAKSPLVIPNDSLGLFKALHKLISLNDLLPKGTTSITREIESYLGETSINTNYRFQMLLIWSIVEAVRTVLSEIAPDVEDPVRELLMDRQIQAKLIDWQWSAPDAELAIELLTVLHASVHSERVADPSVRAQESAERIMALPAGQRYLGINEYDGTWYYNSESFEKLTWYYFAANSLAFIARKPTSKGALADHLATQYESVRLWRKAHRASEFHVRKLLESLEAGEGTRSKTATP